MPILTNTNAILSVKAIFKMLKGHHEVNPELMDYVPYKRAIPGLLNGTATEKVAYMNHDMYNI